MYVKKECPRCHNQFVHTAIMPRDVCLTCEKMNSGTFWYPILEEIKIPTPKTIFIYLEARDRRKLGYQEEMGGMDRFLGELKSAIEAVGLPAFLRTDYHSNKHDWDKSCFIDRTDNEYLLSHIRNLAEFSEMADIEMGDSYYFWMVREMIPTEKAFTAFEGMPIVSEIRYFVRNGKIECKHHYWPKEVFKKKVDYKKLTDIPKSEIDELDKMAVYISKWFSGYWSVDFLRRKDGKWFCTDMALGERSYHEKHKD